MGSLIYAQISTTILKLASQITALQSGGTCETPVLGNLPVDRAGKWYTALIRYPDFMDNFIGKEATCHPSDNIGPLLSASQHLNLNGNDFLLAMAIGYSIECTLEELPVMIKGFDHTVLYAYSVTAHSANYLISHQYKQLTRSEWPDLRLYHQNDRGF